MKWLIDNWSLIVAIIAVAVYFLISGKESVKNYLLYAVTLAEKEFGEKTGRMKLAMVYNAFVSTYPILSKIIPYSVFCAFVDSALVEMRKLIESNCKIADFIGGK